MPDTEEAFHRGFHEGTIPERLQKLEGRVLVVRPSQTTK